MSSAFAEERLVERVLERPQPPLLLGPETGSERQGRARLVARQVDLDPALERPAVDRLGPVGSQVVAADFEQRLRGRPELVREPVHLELAAILGGLDHMRLHVRVRAHDVVVEGDARHGASLYIRSRMLCGVARMEPRLGEPERNVAVCLARLEEAASALVEESRPVDVH